jgi:uncharacterized membrane protein YdbT with pleckstrin-like domain
VSYVESNLIPGETVLYKTGLHWIVLFWPILLGLIFGLPGLILLATSIGASSGSSGGRAVGGLVLLAIAATLVLVGYFSRGATEMAVTNKRVMIKTGFLRRRTFELLLSKVESIGVDEGIVGRVLGYGSVVVRGTGGTPEPFRKVGHPLEFRRQVQQQVEISEQSRSSGQKVIT